MESSSATDTKSAQASESGTSRCVPWNERLGSTSISGVDGVNSGCTGACAILGVKAKSVMNCGLGFSVQSPGETKIGSQVDPELTLSFLGTSMITAGEIAKSRMWLQTRRDRAYSAKRGKRKRKYEEEVMKKAMEVSGGGEEEKRAWEKSNSLNGQAAMTRAGKHTTT